MSTINNRLVSPTVMRPVPPQKPVVSSPAPLPKPLPPTPPPRPSFKTSTPAPLNSLQETQSVERQISQTPTPKLQQNQQMLQRTESFVKPEQTLLDLDDTHISNKSDSLAKTQVKNLEKISKKQEIMTTPPPLSETGDQAPINQISGGVGIGVTSNSLAGRLMVKERNLGDSGVTLALSGGFGIASHESYLDDGRMLQVRSKQADLTVGVTLTEGMPVPVSGSIGVAGSYDVAYARQPKTGETLIQLRQSDPPSKKALIKDPTQTLDVGDEIAFRETLALSCSVGGTEPHSQLKLTVGVSVENEFITSIKRIEGEPPLFRLHIEPSNRKIDGNASVGWGPFAVKGGGSYATTMFYEFDMSAAALSDFMKTKKMPEVPKPDRYLKASKHDQGRIFDAFQNPQPGVKLASMGATQTTELYAEASVSAGISLISGKTSSSKMKSVVVRDGDILREKVHTLSSEQSRIMNGTQSNSLELRQGNRISRVQNQGQTEMVSSYVGLEATLKIGNSQTSESALGGKLELANELLGRTRSPNKLVVPQRSDGKWGDTSVSLKANITPAVLDKLEKQGAFLEHSDPKGQHNVSRLMPVNLMSTQYGVSRSDTEDLLKDLNTLRKDPKLAGNEEAIRKAQGARVATFLASGTTSVVGGEELKRMATLQRLVGPELDLVEVEVTSDIHTKKIDNLAIEGFLATTRADRLSDMNHTFSGGLDQISDLQSRISKNPWDRFNVGSQKLKALEQIREDLDDDTLLDDLEKQNLLIKVDELILGLNETINGQLKTPESRVKVMAGLASAGPILPKELQSLYSSPEKMYDDPSLKEELMDRVVGAAMLQLQNSNNIDEVATLIGQISTVDRGAVGIEQVFKMINAAEAIDPILSKQIISTLSDKEIVALIPRLTDTQKNQFIALVYHDDVFLDSGALSKISTAFESAEKKGLQKSQEFGKKLDGIDHELGKLRGKQARLLAPPTGSVPAPIKKGDTSLRDHVKDNYKKLDQPLTEAIKSIDKSFVVLGEKRHGQLVQRANHLSVEVHELMGDIDRMPVPQRQVLFHQVLKQDVMGEVSQKILQRLIVSSTSGSELAGFAKAIGDKAGKTHTSTLDQGSQSIKSGLKTIKLKDSDYTVKETRLGLDQRLLEIQSKMQEGHFSLDL